jgi:hypothetical protein
VVPHAFEDSQEQLPSRPKAAQKYVLRVGRIGMVEVVFEELVVDSFLIALDISPAWPRRAQYCGIRLFCVHR